MADYWDKLQQTWPARAAQGLWEGLLAPGRALQSTEPMTSEQMIAPAFDMAGLMMGGGIAGTGEGAGAALGSGAARMRMVDNVDLYKELANQRRAAGMTVGKSAEGWDFKRPQAEKGSWDDLFARTKAGWEGDKARAITEYEQAAPGAVPRSPFMSDADYAEVAKPTFTLGSGATDKKTAGMVQGIRAYHGSPHDFDRFDLSKIGTGEGAQAYGHGLYFADSPEVAQAYRNALELRKSGPGRPSYEQPESLARSVMDAVGGDADKAVAEIQSRWDSMKGLDPRFRAAGSDERFQGAIDAIKGGKPLGGGRMYEVNINADPAHFLDWDKPFGQQSDAVREMLTPQRLGLKELGPLGDRGWHGWTDAQNRLIGRAQTKAAPQEIFDPREMASGVYRGGGTWKPPEASEMLGKAGIPGIKYLDQGSRGAGQGSSNYVVFDDKLIDILKKYAMAGTLGAPFFGNGNGNGQQQ